MDSLYFTVVFLVPWLMLACKFGLMFATWALVYALIRLANAATRYVNQRTH